MKSLINGLRELLTPTRTAVNDTAAPAARPFLRKPMPSIRNVPLALTLAALGVGVLMWWGSRDNQEQARARTETAVSKAIGTSGTIATKAEDAAATPVGTSGIIPGAFRRSLPGNVEIMVPAGSTEDRLSMYLSSPTPGSTTLDFDGITFGAGSSALTSESREQIDHIATILRAYPKVRVIVVGPADTAGAEKASLALSRARAQAVANGLTRAGVAPGRVRAQGVKNGKPVADPSTEAGREQNQRVMLVVAGQ